MAKIEVAQAYVTIIPSLRGSQGEIAKELGLEEVGEEGGKGLGKGILGSIKDLALGTALGGLILDGVHLAVDGAKQLFSEAFSGAADFEQNLGGVQKLYGNMGKSVEEYASMMGKSVSEVQGDWSRLENAQNTVLKNAQGAYKTTGMSANQYMETATSFSAALINSLGGDTEAAAAQTQVAMEAISDNWNTFGGDLNMVSQAYQGFAKQNYTMLDNLKLGYGGTKTEMERLIADANEWGAANGRASDLSIDSFSDVVTAIQYIQEKQQIAGTTAREATETVSGSLNMLSAAWTNWLTDLGNKQSDMSARTSELVESLGYAAANVVPLVLRMGTEAIGAIPQLLTSAFGAIKDFLVPLIDDMTGGAATRFMEGFGRITQALAPVGAAFQTVFSKAGEWVQRLMPSLSNLANGAMKVLEGGARAIGWAFEALSPVISFVADLFGGALKAAIDVVSGVFNVLGDTVNTLADLFGPIAEAIVNKVQEIADKLAPIVDGIGGLIGGIGDFFSDPFKAIGDFVTGGTKEMSSMEKSVSKTTTQMSKTTKNNFDNITSTAESATSQVAKNTQTNMSSAATSASSSTSKMAQTTNKDMAAMTSSVTTQTAQMKSQTLANTEAMKTKLTANMQSMGLTSEQQMKVMKTAVESNMSIAQATALARSQAMKNDSASNLGSMASTAGTKMTDFTSKIQSGMSSSLTKVQQTTSSMNNSIKGLSGKTVDLGVKKANSFDSIINAAKRTISAVTGKSVNIDLNGRQTGVKQLNVVTNYTGNGAVSSIKLQPMRAAAGGIATSPMWGIWGEAGNEALIPLSNQRYVRPFAQAVAAEITGGGGVNIHIDEMNVRKESDIDAVANKLGTYVSRRNGGRL